MTSILDQLPYPWVDPVAQELHAVLTRLYPTLAGATIVAQHAGVEVSFLYAQATVYAWHDILEPAAQGGITRDLVGAVRDLLNDKSPSRPFLDDLLAGRPTRLAGEVRNPDGSGQFLRHDDGISEPEALLFHDDLMLEIGRVPGLIATLRRLFELAPAVYRLVVNLPGCGVYARGSGSPRTCCSRTGMSCNLEDETRATAVTAEFGYEDDGHGALAPIAIPGDVASIRSDRVDDWAVIRAREPLPDPSLRRS
jgi:hypothetical protein